jgi:tetratricopeptide (TPR) repeat protein/predicted Ser/Thr protein kinase
VDSADPTLADLPPGAAPGRAARRMGRYVLLEELGRGGMGAVYGAYDPELDRKVAIKVLADDDGDERRRARLLREAQALARLAHPNVVAVHDVGVLDGQIYVAMEHIHGESLRRWLAAPRPWRAIVDMFVEAGRGLAAAHAVGLVHRDFKPDNVMVGSDGRARVLDFGLAALAGAAEPAPPAAPASLEDRPLADADTVVSAATTRDLPVSGTSLLSSRLTVDGARMGTLAYMSPEQFLAAPTTPATDQFSFCVALYEALFRQRPFVGDTAAEYAVAVASGELRPPPRGAAVPRWLWRTLERGLAVDPLQRFPDMPALLAELARDRGRARLLAAALALALAAAVAVALLRPGASPEARCSGADAHLAGVWDDARRADLERAFAATGLAYAADTLARVRPRLDAWATGWTAAHAATCRTHARGELSDALFDRQMTCLKDQLRSVRARADVLARADAAAVEHAVQLVDELPPPSDCADPQRLFPERLVPADPQLAAAVAAQRELLAEVDAEYAAGHYKRAQELVTRLEASASPLGDRALLAEVLHYKGQIERGLGEIQAARAALLASLAAAVESAHGECELEDVIVLLGLAADENSDPKEAAVWAGLAAALVHRERAEQTNDEINRLRAMSQLAALQTDLPEAERLGRAAVALATEVAGPGSLRVAYAHSNLGRALRLAGKLDEAYLSYKTSRDIQLVEYGPNNPAVAPTFNNLAAVLEEQGRRAEAEAEYRAALRIVETSLGPDATQLGYIHGNLTDLFANQGRYAEAEASGRLAVAVFEREFGPDHPRTALALNNLGYVLQSAQRHAEATLPYARSLAIYENTLGPDHTDTSFPLHGLALATLRTGDPARAEPMFRRALAISEKALGPDHRDGAYELIGLGQSLLAQRRAKEAIAPLERALALWSARESDHERAAEARFHLARALWDGGGDRARARREAEQALSVLSPGSPRTYTRPAEIEAWLAAHPPRRR